MSPQRPLPRARRLGEEIQVFKNQTFWVLSCSRHGPCRHAWRGGEHGHEEGSVGLGAGSHDGADLGVCRRWLHRPFGGCLRSRRTVRVRRYWLLRARLRRCRLRISVRGDGIVRVQLSRRRMPRLLSRAGRLHPVLSRRWMRAVLPRHGLLLHHRLRTELRDPLPDGRHLYGRVEAGGIPGPQAVIARREPSIVAPEPAFPSRLGLPRAPRRDAAPRQPSERPS